LKPLSRQFFFLLAHPARDRSFHYLFGHVSRAPARDSEGPELRVFASRVRYRALRLRTRYRSLGCCARLAACATRSLGSPRVEFRVVLSRYSSGE